jgi:small subunit ribosomal protein S5
MYQDYKNVEFVKPGGLDLKDRLVGVQRVTKVTKEDVPLDFLLLL